MLKQNWIACVFSLIWGCGNISRQFGLIGVSCQKLWCGTVCCLEIVSLNKTSDAIRAVDLDSGACHVRRSPPLHKVQVMWKIAPVTGHGEISLTSAVHVTNLLVLRGRSCEVCPAISRRTMMRPPAKQHLELLALPAMTQLTWNRWVMMRAAERLWQNVDRLLVILMCFMSCVKLWILWQDKDKFRLFSGRWIQRGWCLLRQRWRSLCILVQIYKGRWEKMGERVAWWGQHRCDLTGPSHLHLEKKELTSCLQQLPTAAVSILDFLFVFYHRLVFDFCVRFLPRQTLLSRRHRVALGQTHLLAFEALRGHLSGLGTHSLQAGDAKATSAMVLHSFVVFWHMLILSLRHLHIVLFSTCSVWLCSKHVFFQSVIQLQVPCVDLMPSWQRLRQGHDLSGSNVTHVTHVKGKRFFASWLSSYVWGIWRHCLRRVQVWMVCGCKHWFVHRMWRSAKNWNESCHIVHAESHIFYFLSTWCFVSILGLSWPSSVWSHPLDA